MCRHGDTVVLRFRTKVIEVDRCIAEIVTALNEAGINTAASCCGHGKRPGNIALTSGRELVVCEDFPTARQVERCFPPLHPGEVTTNE